MSSLYTMTEQNLTNLSNQVKERLVVALVSQKVLTKQQGALVQNTYAIVVTKKGCFGKAWDKFRGSPDDNDMRIEILMDACTYED